MFESETTETFDSHPMCPEHPTAPLLEYGGEQWCRFCETNKRRGLGILHDWLVLLRWAFVLSLPVLAAAAGTFARLQRSGPHHDLFWWVILASDSFLGACLATVVGRLAIRASDHRHRSRRVRRFQALPLLRDWVVITGSFSVLYGLLLHHGQRIPLFGAPAATEAQWWMLRAPACFVLVAAAFTLAACFSHARYRRRAFVPIYAALFTVAFRAVTLGLAFAAASRPPATWLYTVAGVSVFFLLVLAPGSAAGFALAGRLRSRRKGPIPATIALVGPSNVGRTVFLMRAYSQLSRGLLGKRGLMDVLDLAPTRETRSALDPYCHTLEESREWPTCGFPLDRLPFSLNQRVKELIRFHWLELPQAVFTDPDDWEREAKQFETRLLNVDAVVMMIDARDLALVNEVSELPYASVYTEVAANLHRGLEQVGPDARSVPLAIIITKSCLVGGRKAQQRLVDRVQPLVEQWGHLASQVGLPRPAVQVFLTSAVVTPPADRTSISRQNDGDEDTGSPPQHPEPLTSVNTVEPVVWLAAQVLRANLGVLDAAAWVQGSSALHEASVEMESFVRGS